MLLRCEDLLAGFWKMLQIAQAGLHLNPGIKCKVLSIHESSPAGAGPGMSEACHLSLLNLFEPPSIMNFTDARSLYHCFCIILKGFGKLPIFSGFWGKSTLHWQPSCGKYFKAQKMHWPCVLNCQVRKIFLIVASNARNNKNQVNITCVMVSNCIKQNNLKERLLGTLSHLSACITSSVL